MYKLLNKIRDIKSLQIFTVYLRYLIGGAFVISTFTMNKFGQYGDIKKLTNKIPINELPPAGVLFRVLAESGTYWHFIGISQLISGVLLMTQRFSRLGAIFYFIIILNIFIITIAFDFQEKQSLQIADQTYWIYLGFVMLISIFLMGIFYPSFYLFLIVPFLEGLVGFIIFTIFFWNKK